MEDIQQSNRNLVEVLISRLRAEVPCSSTPGCEFCSWILEKSGSMENSCNLWNSLLDMSSENGCRTARKVALATKGSIFSVTGFCYYCQVETTQIGRNYSNINVAEITGVVEIDSFRFPYSGDAGSSPCVQHGETSGTSIKCFGDVPQFAVLVSSAPLRPQPVAILPLRVAQRRTKPVLTLSPESTFLGNCLYVANPCYINSWIGRNGYVLVQNLGNNTGASISLVQMSEHPFNQACWNLREVLDGIPFSSDTGAYKIQEVLSSAQGPCSNDNIITFPPIIAKQTNNVPKVAKISERAPIQMRHESPQNRSRGNNSATEPAQEVPAKMPKASEHQSEREKRNRLAENERKTYPANDTSNLTAVTAGDISRRHKLNAARKNAFPKSSEETESESLRPMIVSLIVMNSTRHLILTLTI